MKAILTGINQYQHYPEDELRGCCADADNLWMLLVNNLDIPASDILIMKDKLASAKAEKAALLDMAKESGPGDHLVWSHSSHGTNNPDNGQRDGLEELLCSYDIKEKGGVWDLETVISAKFIGELCLKVHPQATLDIIIDACHAPEGDQLKAMGRSYNCARFLPRALVGRPVKPKSIAATNTAIPRNVALWAACQPEETSCDAYIDDSFQGAFTAAFLKSFKPGRSRQDIIYYAREWLKKNKYSQRSHLYGWPELVVRPFGT
jgi:hypothetical protein